MRKKNKKNGRKLGIKSINQDTHNQDKDIVMDSNNNKDNPVYIMSWTIHRFCGHHLELNWLEGRKRKHFFEWASRSASGPKEMRWEMAEVIRETGSINCKWQEVTQTDGQKKVIQGNGDPRKWWWWKKLSSWYVSIWMEHSAFHIFQRIKSMDAFRWWPSIEWFKNVFLNNGNGNRWTHHKSSGGHH